MSHGIRNEILQLNRERFQLSSVESQCVYLYTIVLFVPFEVRTLGDVFTIASRKWNFIILRLFLTVPTRC